MDSCQKGLTQLAIADEAVPGSSRGVGVAAGSEELSREKLTKIVTEFLRPVHDEYMEKLEYSDSPGVDWLDFEIDPKLLQCLFRFTWGPDFFRAPRPMLNRIFKELALKCPARGAPDQIDFYNMLEYHPIEAMSTKLNQIAIAIAMVDPAVYYHEIRTLELYLDDERVYIHFEAFKAFQFVFETLRSVYAALTRTTTHEWGKTTAPDYEELSDESKNVIDGLSALFMKMFRVKTGERETIMKEVVKRDPACVEWLLYLSEMMRLKRRTLSGSRRASPEELEYVNLTLKMEPANPYVRMNLLDCVVDAVRESNGRFQCGTINLTDLDSAMKYLQTECRDLVKKFGNNVEIISIISDYFVRYVPVRFFDPDFSGKLLCAAYKLNRKNPKTTHRYSIFSRMNMKNTKESLAWCEKSLQTDLGFFKANMDYFKTILGKPEEHENVGRIMERRLNSPEAKEWRPSELAEFQFYTGLAFFAEEKKKEALRHLTQVLTTSESLFTLQDVDAACNFFKWDSNWISAEKIRQWIIEECDRLTKIKPEDSNFDRNLHSTMFRMLQLVLGIGQPVRPSQIPGPYSDSKYGFGNSGVLEKIMKLEA